MRPTLVQVVQLTFEVQVDGDISVLGGDPAMCGLVIQMGGVEGGHSLGAAEPRHDGSVGVTRR